MTTSTAVITVVAVSYHADVLLPVEDGASGAGTDGTDHFTLYGARQQGEKGRLGSQFSAFPSAMFVSASGGNEIGKTFLVAAHHATFE